MPWKRLEDIFAGSLEDVLKTSWRRLQNVLKTSWRRLEGVLKTFWRRLEDVFKTSWRYLEYVLKTSWRRLEYVLKTYGQDKHTGLDQDVLKTSSEDVRLRRTYSSWSARLEDENERRLQDVFKMSSSRRMFAGKPNFTKLVILLIPNSLLNKQVSWRIFCQIRWSENWN